MLLKTIKTVIIAIVVVTVFVYTGNALPLTKTCYTVNENILDFAVFQEIINADKVFRKDVFFLGMGLSAGISADVRFELLHNSGFPGKGNIWGDTFAGISFPAGSAIKRKLKFFYYTRFRIPTGPDPGEDVKWANISLGRNELLTGPGVSFKSSGNSLFTLNLFYIFRENENGNLYESFSINPLKKDTWKIFFGLNPFAKGSFFRSENSKNDYCSAAFSFVSSNYYPLVCFGEMYYSHTVRGGGRGNLPIEGEKVNPFLLSAGVKYFVRDNVFFQGSCALTPFRSKGYVKEVWSLGVNIFF